jgi:hypothetical protein
MNLVIIESPYAGNIAESERYARAALADSLQRGEAPYASHLLYTQPGVLDDTDPRERALGMEAGFAWGAVANLVAVYCDLGISKGMRAGIDRAEDAGVPVELRSLKFWGMPAGAKVAPQEPRATPLAMIITQAGAIRFGSSVRYLADDGRAYQSEVVRFTAENRVLLKNGTERDVRDVKLIV